MYLLCSYRSSLVPPPSHTYTLHSFPTRRSSDLTALNRIDSSNLEFVSLPRGIDDETADPKVRLRRKISVSEDRKSTRLNSSHVAISYAVFCLKKKSETTLHQAKRVSSSIRILTY